MSAQPTVVRPAQRKCSSIAYLFWALFGLWGVHQFYLGRRVRGVLYLLTLGLFGWARPSTCSRSRARSVA
jgi:TM2 domain-containing membrane protein YozV